MSIIYYNTIYSDAKRKQLSYEDDMIFIRNYILYGIGYALDDAHLGMTRYIRTKTFG